MPVVLSAFIQHLLDTYCVLTCSRGEQNEGDWLPWAADCAPSCTDAPWSPSSSRGGPQGSRRLPPTPEPSADSSHLSPPVSLLSLPPGHRGTPDSPHLVCPPLPGRGGAVPVRTAQRWGGAAVLTLGSPVTRLCPCQDCVSCRPLGPSGHLGHGFKGFSAAGASVTPEECQGPGLWVRGLVLQAPLWSPQIPARSLDSKASGTSCQRPCWACVGVCSVCSPAALERGSPGGATGSPATPQLRSSF